MKVWPTRTVAVSSSAKAPVVTILTYIVNLLTFVKKVYFDVL